MNGDLMYPSFIVDQIPSDGEARTNLLYVNPRSARNYTDGSNIFLINDFPFTVSPHPAVPEGRIAMNSIQRRLLAVSIAAGSAVTLRKLQQKPPTIKSLTVTIEYITPSKKSGTVDCEEFVGYFLNNFTKQCFRETQVLVIILGSGVRLTGTVTRMSLDGEGHIGVLTTSSTVCVVPSEKSAISLINISDSQLDAQQPQLMRAFNLEGIGIGGLKDEFSKIFRRAFASRLFPPSYVKKFGIKHVKGVLLFGPPGTGKTLIARKIGEILNCHPPKIVNGPEVFNKFVGGTEENVRNLFADAEVEYNARGDQSQLHLIIFDEFDAICRQRGAAHDSTGVSGNVVNQLLSKIDGVNSLNNVLLIGMTNRLDLIDDAILRPGRFEVHVEIGLPNESGREEIFRIHTRDMKDHNVLDADVNVAELAGMTKNYSGAEIEGVVRSAASCALNPHIDMGNPTNMENIKDMRVSRQHFLMAIDEVLPAFGQAKEECGHLKRGGIIHYGLPWEVVENRCTRYVEQLKADGKRIHSLTVLIAGPPGSGKSAVSAYLAEKADFPFLKVVSNEDMVGYGEMQKVNILRKAFEDAYKSPASVIILDDLERIMEFSHLGGRYSNAILQALLVLIKRPPPEGKKLLVIGTTSLYDILDSLEIVSCFSVMLQISMVSPQELIKITKELCLAFATPADELQCVELFPTAMPIKQLLLVLEMAAEQNPDGKQVISAASFAQALESIGAHTRV